MSVKSDPFILSAAYYDLIYEEKDYQKEGAYVNEIIKQINPSANSLLELGSGTGNYSEVLCNLGFQVTGIEQSERMLALSNAKRIPRFKAMPGSMEAFTLNARFDVAVSLFHVLGYLVDTRQVLSCFKHVCNHLEPGGLFIFDGWYTPAVYTQLPQKKTKTFENDLFKVSRTAEPKMDYKNNYVELSCHFSIKNKMNEQEHSFTEMHLMRHFSTPEIALIAEMSGFQVLRSEEFLTAKEPCENTWGVCYTLQKND